MTTIAWAKNPPKSGELEFSLNTAPVSQQSSNRRKRHLTKTVRKVLTSVEYLFTGDIELDIEWYIGEKARYESDGFPDIDNIIKPLLDALKGPAGIMIDDCQVESVRCRWVDWTKSDQKLAFQIRYTPDLWLKKEGLKFIDIGNNLCFPLPAAVPDDAKHLVVLVAQMSQQAKKNLEDGEMDYYRARLILPLQRFYHRSKLDQFEVMEAMDLLKGTTL